MVTLRFTGIGGAHRVLGCRSSRESSPVIDAHDFLSARVTVQGGDLSHAVRVFDLEVGCVLSEKTNQFSTLQLGKLGRSALTFDPVVLGPSLERHR
jgi:hypothetical protein